MLTLGQLALYGTLGTGFEQDHLIGNDPLLLIAAREQTILPF